MEFSRAFCKAFKQIRKERGLSIERVASRSKLSLYVLNRVEKEVSNPSFDKILMMAKGLGIKPSELIMRAEAIYNHDRTHSK